MNKLARLVPMALFFVICFASCSILSPEPNYNEPVKVEKPLGDVEMVMIDSGNRVESRGRVNVRYATCTPPVLEGPFYAQYFCDHGTHMVKAVIDQAAREGFGELNLKVLTWTIQPDITRRLIEAVDLEPKVITMALSGEQASESEYHALTYASMKDVLVLIASGNRGWDKSEWPARYSSTIPCVVSVSTSANGRIADFTVAKASAGDIYIPQVGVETGTSFSVSRAGAIAMAYYRRNPKASCKEAKQALIQEFGAIQESAQSGR